jgi:hypothetical protein
MDGQLGPDQQLLVESALVSDPRLGEELRSLTAVRDLVAGLPRSATVDVTARVRDRIRAKSRLAGILSAVPGAAVLLRRPARAAGVLGIAAGILIAVVLSFAHLSRSASLPDRANPTGEDVVSLESSPSLPPASFDAPESRWPSFPRHSDHKGASSPSKAKAHRPRDSRQPAAKSGSLEYVSQYLDNPDLHQMFVVSDSTDGSAPRRVASVVEQTTRFNYYKITIAQGIVIDPRHPDEATVFAVVVNPSELNSLRDQLHTVFHERVEEAPVDPKVVTQLADIGQVQAYPPAPIAEVVIPREAVAFRSPDAEVRDRPAPDPVAEAPLGRDRPTPEQERSSPAADLASLKNSVVLVWVARVRPG